MGNSVAFNGEDHEKAMMFKNMRICYHLLLRQAARVILEVSKTKTSPQHQTRTKNLNRIGRDYIVTARSMLGTSRPVVVPAIFARRVERSDQS